MTPTPPVVPPRVPPRVAPRVVDAEPARGLAAGPAGRVAGALGRRLGWVARTLADAVPHWATGAFAGVQGALLSWLVVVVPTMAVYVATSADPANAQVGWPSSVAVGSALWLLGQGGALQAAGAHVALVPLGLAALVVFAGWASARRSAHRTVGAWVAATGGHLAMAAVVLVAVGATGPLGAGPGAVARTLIGGTLAGGLGLGLGIARRGELVGWVAARSAAAPEWLRLAVRAGLVAPGLLVLAGAGVVATWAVAGRASTGDVLAALGVDAFGGAMLAVAQLTLVPNLVLWAVSWLVGTGFAVGAGTHFAPSEVLGGPMPALPLLGALPSHAGGALVWTPAVVVLVGAVLAWWLHRRLPEQAAWQPLATAAVAVLVAGLALAGLAALSGGPVGPGRLAVVGPPPVLVALDAARLLAPGVLLVVPASPLVRDAVRRAVRRARPGPEPEPTDEPARTDDGSERA